MTSWIPPTYGDEGSPDGEARSVQGMDELWLTAVGTAESRLHAAGLKGLAVAAR